MNQGRIDNTMVMNNNLQNTTQKSADRATRTPLKTGCPGRVAVPASYVVPIVLLL